MPPKLKESNALEHQFLMIYQQDYTKWLAYGRGRGYTDELITDAIQEMSLRILDRSDQIPTMDERGLKAYIMTTFKHALTDLLGERKAVSLEDLIVYDNDTPEEMVLDDIEYESLCTAVKELSEQHQQFIYLKYYLNLPTNEIGKRMKLKDNAVRTLKQRAIQALRRHMSKDEGSVLSFEVAKHG